MEDEEMSAEAVEHNNKVHECGGTRGLVVEELNGLASTYGTWVTGNPSKATILFRVRTRRRRRTRANASDQFFKAFAPR
jgi:hypothetical protein